MTVPQEIAAAGPRVVPGRPRRYDGECRPPLSKSRRSEPVRRTCHHRPFAALKALGERLVGHSGRWQGARDGGPLVDFHLERGLRLHAEPNSRWVINEVDARRATINPKERP